MAPTTPYPSVTLRSILRAHASASTDLSKPVNLPSSGGVEAIAFVAYLAHLKRLAAEVKEQGSEGSRRKQKIGKKEIKEANKRLLEQLED
ncbi:hypothetical protein JCM11641_008311 [Rhodosporidiobolus odoratus]